MTETGMALGNHVRAFLRSLRNRLALAIQSHRVRARHPTLIAHPTVIWDYGFHDLDALEIGQNVSVGPFAEIIVYHRSVNLHRVRHPRGRRHDQYRRR
jgi:hypothetical protein